MHIYIYNSCLYSAHVKKTFHDSVQALGAPVLYLYLYSHPDTKQVKCFLHICWESDGTSNDQRSASICDDSLYFICTSDANSMNIC